MNAEVLRMAVRYVFKHGTYIADAIQLASAAEFERFLTFDERLRELARAESLRVFALEPRSWG